MGKSNIVSQVTANLELLLDTIAIQEKAIERLEKENSVLATRQCVVSGGLIFSYRGHTRCSLRDGYL